MRWGIFVSLLLLALSVFLGRTRFGGYQGDDWATYDQKVCLVLSVPDGDTLTLRPLDGSAQAKVRLLGIDAPEMRDDAGKPAYWAREADAYLGARTHAKSITVRLEQGRTRDKYGRLLAYLYVDDRVNLNLDLVREGHVYADRRFSHSMRPQFEQAENEARARERGLWKSVRESQMPPWRQRWLEERREWKRKRR